VGGREKVFEGRGREDYGCRKLRDEVKVSNLRGRVVVFVARQRTRAGSAETELGNEQTGSGVGTGGNERYGMCTVPVADRLAARAFAGGSVLDG